MVKIKIDDLMEYATEILAFGGQITKNNIKEYVGRSVETNLTRQGLELLKMEYTHTKNLLPSFLVWDWRIVLYEP